MTGAKDYDRLADFVRSERAALGLSRAALAARMGMNPRTVTRIHTGKSVDGDTYAKLEIALQWAPGSVRRVLEGGYPGIADQDDDAGPPWLINGELDLRDEVEREIWEITDLDEPTRWAYIVRRRKRLTGQQSATGR